MNRPPSLRVRPVAGAWPALVVAEEPKGDIGTVCLEVALGVVLSKALFGFLEELRITVWDAANPSAFAVLELDELRRRAHRRHTDDDVGTSPVDDDCSNFEHSRMRTPTGCTTSPSATSPSAPIPRFARLRSTSRIGRSASMRQLEQRLRLPRSSGRSGVRRDEGERIYPRSIRIAERPIFPSPSSDPRGSFAPDLGHGRPVAFRPSATRTA